MSRVDRRDAAAREDEIAEVAAACLRDNGAGVAGTMLVVGDPTGRVAAALSCPVLWNRCAGSSFPGVAWPTTDRVDGAVLRLPGGWPAFQMAIHATAARLAPGASMWIYGGGDEGITSVEGRLDDLFTGMEIVALKRRTRVLRAVRTDTPALGALSDWRRVDADGWIAYPGLFSAGHIDSGTAVLIEALPTIAAHSAVLDFASGSGRVAGAILACVPSARVTLTDHDALAITAAGENVPSAELIIGDGWAGLDARRRFDWIVSNPPIHRGRREDFSVLATLIAEAPSRLTPRGSLVAVVQRTVGAGRLFAEAFRTVERLAETPHYQVWRGSGKAS